MATIEERAADFGEKHYLTNVESERTSAEDGYITGATEQRSIDIEKACKWLAENADNYSRSSLTDISRYLWVDPHLIEDFRKAMEEQE